MTTASVGTTDELGPVIKEFADGTTRIVEGVNAVIAAVNSVIDALPAATAATVHSTVDEVRARLDEALTRINHVLAYTGDVAALRHTGDAWAMQVGGPVSGLSTVMTLTTMEADDQWHGVAATAYRNTLPPQSAALATIKTFTDKINEILQDLAGAIATFWVAASTALLTLIVALVVAAPVAATVVGAPFGAGWSVTALVAFGAAILAEIAALAAIIVIANKDGAALENTLTADTAFPRGGWPVSTTGLGDASLRDGDDTDWKVGQ